MDPVDLNELRSVDELTAHQTAVRARMTQLHQEHAGVPFPDEAREEFAQLQATDIEIEARVTELSAREGIISRHAGNPANRERVDIDSLRGAPRPTQRDNDVYDLSNVTRSLGDPTRTMVELRARARVAIERATFPHPEIRSQDAARQYVTDLVERMDDEQGTIALRILTTGSPTYHRAFAKGISFQPLTDVEVRALSLAGASGGFAVPFQLDPTIIPTSNGTVNPLRAISRVVQIPGDEWRGVSSGAITAAYSAEATETTDNAPTLTQPTISTEKAQAFVPFSIEVGMDWGSLQSEMAFLLQEAKDDLEAVKFMAGTGTNEPFGLLTGITNTVNAAAGQTFTLANLYSLAAALPPRYRPRARWTGNLAVINRIRQFDTAGGAALWETLANDAPPQLLGKPFHEASEMADVATSVKFLAYGDFTRFVIVDRVGLNVELIQHLVGTNHRPTGQRGLYAYWRNSSKVVDANAFRALIGVA